MVAGNPMAATARDPFDDARSAFVKLEDLLGRLVLVVPKEKIVAKSTMRGQEGKEYDKIIADTIVLDGDVTEKIEEVPITLEDLHWSGQAVVAQLKPKLRKVNGMVLGRLGQIPSSIKGGNPAWILNAPDDDDKVLARPAAAKYIEDHAEPDPFD